MRSRKKYRDRDRCSVCGATRREKTGGGIWCLRCDEHATGCVNRFHVPGRCRFAATDRRPPAGLWDETGSGDSTDTAGP